MAATAPAGVAVLSEGITYAVSRLVDDWKDPREPSHGDLKFVFQKAGLAHVDATNPMGKERRVRHVLSWALEHDEDAGERLVASLIEQIRACGGFRPESPNYVGEDAIANAQDAFASEGLELTVGGGCVGDFFPPSTRQRRRQCSGSTRGGRSVDRKMPHWSLGRARISWKP